MAVVTGFTNSFTAGEIFDDATDRVDIQPIAKGCNEATNLIVQATGPLKKRRGFWYLGDVADSTKLGRLIPFRRSVTDALMLELGDLTCRVWQSDGSPLLNLGVQVSFATPFASAEVGKLRFKQVADVIYFTSSDGIQPQALSRASDISWSFAVLAFPNGPWQPENIVTTDTITLTGTTITDVTGSISPQAAAIKTGQAVTVAASSALFTGANVGDKLRIRAGTGSASTLAWSAGFNSPVGVFRLSVGNVYVSTFDAGSADKDNVTNPPVQTDGSQSDGCSTFDYLHDGAGIVEITAYTDATHVSGVVRATTPVGGGSATSYYAFSAYGGTNGWPRAWPSAIEERLVMGATAGNRDFIDFTRTAGFTPAKADFHPGQGTGAVVATDAIRRRLGDDGGELLWTRISTYLIAGTASGEYIISGGLFGDPITPSSVRLSKNSEFGSADVYPALLEKGLAYVTRGGHTVRTIRLDQQQNDTGADVSFLANHIETRGFAQLTWIPAPDRTLWARLSDGGLAAWVNHEEQQVRGWTRQALAMPKVGALTVEDVVSIPGPGLLETIWLMASGTVGGQFRRFLMMQSRDGDGVWGMDVAALYDGAPVAAIGGLGYLEGETVRVMANGVQIVPQAVTGGAVAVPAGTTHALIGLPWSVTFRSLKIDQGPAAAHLLGRQRIAGVVADLLGTVVMVGQDGGLMEQQSSRKATDALTGPVARRFVSRCTLAGNTDTDPRILITEDSGYDFGIYALRPSIAAGS